MKNLKTPFFAGMISLMLASCGGTPNPVEYNNQLMSVINENEKHMNAMNTAMVSQDYTKAETVRKTWVEELDKSIAAVDKIDALADDEGLKSAVSQGLKDYKKIAEKDYPALIGLRTKEKAGDVTAQPQIQAALDSMNHSFESIGGKVNKAATNFEKKYSKG